MLPALQIIKVQGIEFK